LRTVGAGKTKLVSHIVNSFLAQSQPNVGLAYFYYNRNEALRTDPENVLRCYVNQLSIAHDKSRLHTALREKYTEKSKSGFASNQLSLDECQDLIQLLSKAYTSTILILDALDECDEKLRLGLMKAFDRLIDGVPKLKIFISSRPDDDIRRRMMKRANVGVNATKNEEDIKQYILARLAADEQDRNESHREKLSEELRKDITATVFAKSDGMYVKESIAVYLFAHIDQEQVSVGSAPNGPATGTVT
jgi:hypothetical protein